MVVYTRAFYKSRALSGQLDLRAAERELQNCERACNRKDEELGMAVAKAGRYQMETIRQGIELQAHKDEVATLKNKLDLEENAHSKTKAALVSATDRLTDSEEMLRIYAAQLEQMLAEKGSKSLTVWSPWTRILKGSSDGWQTLYVEVHNERLQSVYVCPKWARPGKQSQVAPAGKAKIRISREVLTKAEQDGKVELEVFREGSNGQRIQYPSVFLDIIVFSRLVKVYKTKDNNIFRIEIDNTADIQGMTFFPRGSTTIQNYAKKTPPGGFSLLKENKILIAEKQRTRTTELLEISVNSDQTHNFSYAISTRDALTEL